MKIALFSSGLMSSFTGEIPFKWKSKYIQWIKQGKQGTVSLKKC